MRYITKRTSCFIFNRVAKSQHLETKSKLYVKCNILTGINFWDHKKHELNIEKLHIEYPSFGYNKEMTIM